MNKHALLFLLLTTSASFGGESNFMQTSDGLVVIEAEHFQANTPQSSHQWATQSAPAASGGEMVVAQPADQMQINKPEEIATQAPRLDYKVTFLMPGRHYLWVKGQGAFAHVGLNGVPVLNGQRIGGFPGKNLDWRNNCRATYGQPAFVEVPAPGEYTLNLWMQTAGTAVDKILLSPLADFKPGADYTLPESPRGELPPQPPQVNAGPEKEINPPNATVSLEGEAKDYDGKVAGYAWSQVDGPAMAVFTPPDAAATKVGNLTALGIYHFRLTAKDDGGLSSSRDVKVKVTPAVPPTVKVAVETVLLTDSALDIYSGFSDADSDIKAHPLTFSWEQVSGPSQATRKILNKSTLSLSDLVEGTYVFRFSATDFTGNTSSAETKVIKRPAPPATAIDATDPRIQYFGRFNELTAKDPAKPSVMECGWTATSIRARFEGTSLRARLVLTGWGGGSHFYAIIDGNEKSPITLGVDNRTDWLVVEGLPDTVHTIELIRLGGAWNWSSTFSGFFLDAGKKLVDPPPRPSRRIEFYGDSITEGAMMSDQPLGSNGYLGYAATAARLLKADASIIAKSGMGLVKGFTLPQTLPGMYDRGAPMRGDVKWDFSKWTPHVVVVNIGQNDAWTGTDPAVFVDTYMQFIKALRSHYPNALIVCTLGSMDATAPNSKWPGLVTQAVERLKTEENDTRIETFFFEFLGAKGHPNSIQARAMAEKLSAFLESKGDSLWIDQPIASLKP